MVRVSNFDRCHTLIRVGRVPLWSEDGRRLSEAHHVMSRARPGHHAALTSPPVSFDSGALPAYETNFRSLSDVSNWEFIRSEDL